MKGPAEPPLQMPKPQALAKGSEDEEKEPLDPRSESGKTTSEMGILIDRPAAPPKP
jgi:hypothetical protein